MSNAESTGPVWDEAAPPQRFLPLREDLTADVCVVGAGIAGMTTAYELARAGIKVVVLDTGAVGGGQTGLTTAHLVSAQDDFYQVIERMHGAEGARLARESHQAAVERIDQIAREEEIECDLVRLDGYFILAEGDSIETLNREREAARRAGFADVEVIDGVPDYPFDTGPALRFPRQGRFHPGRYLHGLARAVRERGGQIFTDTHVEEVNGGAEASVRTRDGHTVRAGAVVVTTNSPISDRFIVHLKQAPYLTYVIGARVPVGSVPDALVWDTGDPYRYIRLQRVRRGGEEQEILIVGGEDHHTGEDYRPGERFEALTEWTRARFAVLDVPYRWSGQVFEPVDLMAFIGRDPSAGDNVYLATGDSGQGMTHGTIAGMLISDLIRGRANPWERLYDPARVTLDRSAAKDFVRAQLKVLRHYTEWLTGTEDAVDSETEIPPGSGAVVRPGGRPTALYRAPDGTLHRMSAVCPHLGCIVHWNETADTWDCPCHGSRFHPTGEVLNGPAPTSLAPLEEETDG